MKRISKFLLIAFAMYGANAYAAAPVATTAGSNLTAYNGNSGATNNAMWNGYVNARSNSAASAPTADFGNCNAVIMRCAQPKCANGGCSSLEIARPIVSGCVESNSTCKQYGEDLIDYISAQLVATSTANATQAAADAQVAAAQAAAQQSAQQMAQMQQQMSQMQQQMQQQSADTAAQIQAALAQQQQATSQAIADATVAANANVAAQSAATTTATSTGESTSSKLNLTTAQKLAAESGISADLLAREQISGEILTGIENAEISLKKAEAAMKEAFEYAGCNSTGSNCTGPKRVSTFKTKAMAFFDPYNEVLDEVYDSLILAQSLGVDITDIYMMLNGTCNAWGQYLCSEGQVMHYTVTNCQNGVSVPITTKEGTTRGGMNCKIGQVVPMSDGGCQLIKVLADDEEVKRNWLYPEPGVGGVQVRVGCASEILDNSTFFRNRKKAADIDIEILQRMIEQDAPSSFGSLWGNSKSTPMDDGVIYCAVTEKTYADLQKHAALKTLPDKVCVPQDKLASYASDNPVITEEDDYSVVDVCASLAGNDYARCVCENGPDKRYTVWDDKNNACKCNQNSDFKNFDIDLGRCTDSDGKTRADKEREDSQNAQKEKYKTACEAVRGKFVDAAYLSCNCDDAPDKELCEKVNEDY